MPSPCPSVWPCLLLLLSLLLAVASEAVSSEAVREWVDQDSLEVVSSGAVVPAGHSLTLSLQRRVGQQSSRDWVGLAASGDSISPASPSLEWEYVNLQEDNTAYVNVSTDSLAQGRQYDAFYLADGGYRSLTHSLTHLLASLLA